MICENTHVQLIVLRLIDKYWCSQDVYYDYNVILPELETVVTATNSLYSTVIQ